MKGNFSNCAQLLKPRGRDDGGGGLNPCLELTLSDLPAVQRQVRIVLSQRKSGSWKNNSWRALKEKEKMISFRRVFLPGVRTERETS